MAASVRLEDEAFSDVRIELLGTLAGYNRYEALGRMAHLWRLCTQRSLHVVSEALVIASLGPAGVDAIVGAELGERVDGGIRIRGTRGRIEWLSERRAAAAAGGRANGARTKGRPRGGQARATSEPSANGGPATREPGESQVTAKPEPSDSPPAPAPAPAPAQDQKQPPLIPPLPGGEGRPGGRRRTKRPPPGAPTAEEHAAAMRVLGKLSERSGVRYQGATEHIRLITARMRDGIDEMQLRHVVAYCATQLGWQDKPDMQPYLRPETLFGPSSIARYLDAAETWAATIRPAPTDRRGGADHDARA